MKNNPIVAFIGAAAVVGTLHHIAKSNNRCRDAEYRANDAEERARNAEQRANQAESGKVDAEARYAGLLRKNRALEAKKTDKKPSSPRKANLPKSK